MPDFVPISDSLPDECLGAAFITDSLGNTSVIAGTRNNLYKLDTSSSPYTWIEVSKSTDAYQVPVDEQWQFKQFGDYIIACNLGSDTQYMNAVEDSKFSDLAGAPRAKYVFAAGDFLVLANLPDEPTSLRWSGLNDIEHWEIGVRGSDTQFIPTGGEIMGAVEAGNGAIIMMKNSIYAMNFSPSVSYVFSFSVLNANRGAVAPYCLAAISSSQFYYLSEDGFFEGVSGSPIGAEKIDRWFTDNLDFSYLHNVEGRIDPFEKIVWWRFRSIEGNALIGYDWQLQKWCYSDADISALTSILTPALSWEGLSGLYATIDDVTVPFDSRLFKGGRPTLTGFNSSNQLSSNSGSNRRALIYTNEIKFNKNGRAYVNDGELIGDPLNYTFKVGVSDYRGGEITYGPDRFPSSFSKRLPIDADGAVHKFRVEIDAGETWSIMSGMNFPDGSVVSGGEI